jgi:transcription initiation factor TFIIE subunit alpha
MLNNKTIYAIVKEVCGEAEVEVVKALKKRKNFSEFKLAEKIDRNINETRNLLYNLHRLNLVSFIRKKDKKKGWYIYYWTFKLKAILPLLLNTRKKKLNALKMRLQREKANLFFICGNSCVRTDFDQASNFEFKCPECGEIMNPEDNAKKTSALEKEIKRLEKIIKTLGLLS